jgi:hypothetical protein
MIRPTAPRSGKRSASGRASKATASRNPLGGAAGRDAPSSSRPTPETNAQPPRTIAAMPAAAARPASVDGESRRWGGRWARSLVTVLGAVGCASEGDSCGRAGEDDPFRPGRVTSTRVTTGIGDGDSTPGHDNEHSSRHPRPLRRKTACEPRCEADADRCARYYFHSVQMNRRIEVPSPGAPR